MCSFFQFRISDFTNSKFTQNICFDYHYFHSENRLTALGELPCCLQSLVVDDNKLTTLHLENHPALTAVTATNNVITSCRVGNLPQLKVHSVCVWGIVTGHLLLLLLMRTCVHFVLTVLVLIECMNNYCWSHLLWRNLQRGKYVFDSYNQSI